jgi:hypothetical protein
MMTEENMKVAAGRGSIQVDFGPLRLRQGPEKQLMIAVLQDALDCLVKYRFATTHFERRLFEDARRWILADRAVGPFSFAFIWKPHVAPYSGDMFPIVARSASGSVSSP